MKYFKKVSGENVYLSPMNVDDLDLCVKWFNDKGVTDGLGDNYLITSYYSEREWIEEKLKKQEYQFAIVSENNDNLLGTIGFENINNINRTATVGLFIGEEENRSKGYGTEALKLIVGFGFDVLNLNNIMLNVFEFNERAIKSYNKVGFKQYGRRRQAHYSNNKYHDVICMDIIRDDWYKI